jgi:putative Mg2+ transporter-C (MgtC) family protein
MPLHLTWQQIALRLLLASFAGFVIGLNRDERGHRAGIRTNMLVCLAAALAMLQVNLLLPLAGKLPSSFVVMDLMRLPLGILSGIGFIGAGVIIKRTDHVAGITTAATIWLVTVLGLLFGGGNLYLGIAGTLLALAILWLLKFVENVMPRQYHGSLHLTLSPNSPGEADIRRQLLSANWTIVSWSAAYYPPTILSAIDCELKHTARASRIPETPPSIDQLRAMPGIRSLSWKE